MTATPEHHEGIVHLTGEGNAPTEIDVKHFDPAFLEALRNEAAARMGVDPETLTLSVTAVKTEEQPDA